MKKNSFLYISLFCISIFCSCTVTSRVTSFGVFDNTLKEVAEELDKEGYGFVGRDKDRNNVRNYYPEHYNNFEHGFSGTHSIEYIYTDTYRFANDKGETMRYSVSYETKYDPSSGVSYVSNVSTKGCETSNPEHYHRLCGEGSPIHKLENLPTDTVARH